MTARPAAEPPVMASHRIFIWSRVCEDGSWQARSTFGASLDRCGLRCVCRSAASSSSPSSVAVANLVGGVRWGEDAMGREEGVHWRAAHLTRFSGSSQYVCVVERQMR
jgi:hypothetical protein